MPKIKTLKFSLNGQSVDLNIYCSKEGMFSASIHRNIAESIGLSDNECVSKNLSEVESFFSKAFAAYNNDSKKELELLIGIRLRVGGVYAKAENGNLEQIFQENPRLYESCSFMSDVDGVKFDFRVILQEKYCSSKTHYSTRKYTGDPSLLSRYDRYKDGYRSNQLISVRDYDVLIPYSEQIMDNLLSIQKQLRNASLFLASLVASENISELLNNQNLKLLEGQK